jgi:glutamate synthase domain-containing protein 3
LKLALLGADRIGFGTSALMAMGCAMLRQCHLAGPQPGDATGTRRLGCTTGVATQDPLLVARFAGRPRHLARYLWLVAHEMRTLMASIGIRHLGDVVGRRDMLERKPDLTGKAALVDVGHLVSAPPRRVQDRHLGRQSQLHMPPLRVREDEAAERAIDGEDAEVAQRLTNADRAVGVAAAGKIARAFGDAGLRVGRLRMRHRGAAGHFYAAYALPGMEFRMQGVLADSGFTAAYGGKLVVVPDVDEAAPGLTLVGNTFGYGARGGRAFIAGRAGNRFGICLRKGHEGDSPRIVVEGVAANAFQYMTGGVALVLGPAGFNLGAGMTGGIVYLVDPDPGMLSDYVAAMPLTAADVEVVRALLGEHVAETASQVAQALMESFDPARFVRVATSLKAETEPPGGPSQAGPPPGSSLPLQPVPDLR